MAEIMASMLTGALKPICSCCWEMVSSFTTDKISKARNAISEMKKLEDRLRQIQPILRDACNKQFRSKEVKDWLWKLNDVTFDARDAIDLFRVKSPRPADTGDSQQSKVRKIFNSISDFRKKWEFLYEVGSMVKDANERINEIFEEADRYGLQPLLTESCSLEDNLKALCVDRRTTSSTCESKIVGLREKDEEVVINWLLEESNQQEESAYGIAIVGMGGVGKTTLAKNIYDNSTLEKRFDKCMWVCIGEKSKRSVVLKMILEGVERRTTQFTNEDKLLSEIKKYLRNKKFLLVLDDLWEYGGWWEDLKSLWKSGCKSGSKVIVTTRRIEFAEAMGLAPYKLKCLNEEQSWELLVKQALRDEREEVFEGVLKDVGRKIAAKCGGLPLALSVVGSLLRQKVRSKSVWQDVLDSPVWDWNGPENDKGVFSAIALSFMSIPFQTKQCLLYCCLYPKDFQMVKADLVRSWVAEGIISKEDGVEIEVTAEKCLDDLVARSLIQEEQFPSWDDDECCKLHDLVHDFALDMRGKEYVSMDRVEKASDSTRYVSSTDEACGELTALRGRETSKLRGLMCQNVCRLSDDDFKGLTWLRVLDLREGLFKELPESIGDLVLLRYLNLSRTYNLEQLPESIVKLHELQTLDLRRSGIRRLPSNISELGALRHLDIRRTKNLVYLPSGIGKLTCLQTLSKFVVGSDETSGEAGSTLAELQELNNLREELKIEHLERVGGSSQEADRAQLKSKERLEELWLCCDQKCAYEVTEAVAEKMEETYERMEPPEGIEVIVIDCYPGRKLPGWISSNSYSCLRFISMWGCNFLEKLPGFGFLPNLESLKITNAKRVEVFDATVDRHGCHGKAAFPKLVVLWLEGMESLKEWKFDPNRPSMPCIRRLLIWGCPQLKLVPDSLHTQGLVWVDIAGCGRSLVMWFIDLLNQQPSPNLRFLQLVSSVRDRPEEPFENKMTSSFEIDCEEMSVKLGELMLWLGSQIGFLIMNLPMPGLDSLPPWIEQLQQLEYLIINGSPHLARLPDSVARLSQLRLLGLVDLPELVEMPASAIEGLRRLQKLFTKGCPKLSSLPDELWRLPRLEEFTIHESPLLAERYRSEEERHNIPHIRVDIW